MDNNNNNNQIQNANENENENEMKNLEKKVTKNLIKDYSNLLNGNSFKDFSIFVENKSNPFEIKVHKSILSSRSPFFNESLRQESLSISLNQFNKKEMESILSYIYYGNISFENQENLIQLLEISIYFKLNLLKEIIQKKISNSINYSNFFQFLFQNRNLNSNEIEIKYSISKQDFDKLKQFDFFPKSFLVDIQNKVIQDNQKEIENKEKEIEEKWKKEVEDKNKEIEDKNKEIEDKNKEIEDKNKEIENKEKENQQMKIEIEEKWKKENFPQFSDSEIIKDIEYVKKLQEWINDNDFFSKMKKGFSAKRDGFSGENWQKAVDDKGKTLVIIKTKDNFIFGGFTQVGWTMNTSKWSYNGGSWGRMKDENAFIFSLRNDKGDRNPAKFTIQKGKEDLAIQSQTVCGPYFGSNSPDFYLCSNLQPGYSNFGSRYNLPNGITFESNEAYSYLAGSHDKWVVDELETYFI
ncbi:pep-cterm sorting domain-containing protein [Anaeramoeba ignava]|uniref:Pep-cterm sorting domain-containing protein n=1 Tax=Anaeramoeba ignava TaxID=1746090 RepID=A0A9Q0LIZ3_ANAIG|nr:pep-cterm sorting domain-containing protein [Anaeramoeba ignava]